MGLISGIVFAAALGAPNAETARPIRYQSFQDGVIYYHAVIADMSTYKVTAEAFYAEKLTNAWKMIGKKQPAAAITGTFFGFGTQQPVADVIVDGKLVAKGNRGSAVAVDWYGQVSIFDTKFEQEIDHSGYKHMLRGGIRLMTNGVVRPNPKAQHFTDAGLWGKAPRTGIGLSKDEKLVLFATNNRVTLSQFGKAMKTLGVYNAVAFDGGGSTMLYYRGSLVLPPKRNLSTMFILHERPPW